MAATNFVVSTMDTSVFVNGFTFETGWPNQGESTKDALVNCFQALLEPQATIFQGIKPLAIQKHLQLLQEYL